MSDGRTATRPYRVRVRNVWYWVDPTVPAGDIAPGDVVVIYPVAGDATLATLRTPLPPAGDEAALARPVEFSTPGGERFSIPASDLAALHLAAIDEDQT